MEGQLRRSQRMQLWAMNAETQQVGTNEAYGENTDTDNYTHIHGETENNGNYERIHENPQTVDDSSANPTTRLDVLTPATTTRRYPRQRVVVHDDDSPSFGSVFTTPTYSIREGDRLATRSTGVPSNNTFNINYF